MRPVAAALLSLALLGVSISAWAADAPSAVMCESIIDPGGSTEWKPRRVVLGVVAVPPTYLPQTVTTGGTQWPYWSKAGLVVRADSPPVLVTVPARWRRQVAIGWGQGAQGAVLRFESCAPSSSLGEWNPYTGGFLLKAAAACVPLTFTVARRSATVRFGVGKRCT